MIRNTIQGAIFKRMERDFKKACAFNPVFSKDKHGNFVGIEKWRPDIVGKNPVAKEDRNLHLLHFVGRG